MTRAIKGVRVDSLSRLTLLPRSLKTLILIAVDAVIGGMAFWLSVLVRTGFIPRMPDHYLLGATALAMLAVPAAGITFGLYRPVIRFHIPLLSLRAGLVGGLCGDVIAALAWAGGAPY